MSPYYYRPINWQFAYTDYFRSSAILPLLLKKRSALVERGPFFFYNKSRRRKDVP
ncbi:hypothetical protein [Domibacillus epiphyticus]|uniref:hypothetical protein n=1 Tax=Domibacillus epiphyticus TaxID=1714355 RepID=UPI0013014384|nr:hypothetical protein [Domibacillus epiphyticus]